jgi:hypothetical protein
MAIVANLADPNVSPDPHRPSITERSAPFTSVTIVVPNDNQDLLNNQGVAEPARGLFIGTAGNLNVLLEGEIDPKVIAVTAGLVQIAAKRIYSTNTSALNIIAGR